LPSKPEAKNQTPVNQKSKKLGIDPEVLKKRAERFGLPADKPAAPATATAAPAANGGKVTAVVSTEDEEKKRKRAERFATDAVSSHTELYSSLG
jgi:SAP domain-containing ribonucleoprotein